MKTLSRACIFFSILLLTACGGSTDSIHSTKLLAENTVVETVANFAGLRKNYSITKAGAGYSVTDQVGGEGSRTVNGVTSLKFADVTVNLTIADLATQITVSDLNSLTELYVAFFNRVPDAEGLAYWIGQFKAGRSINDIANEFYNAGIANSSSTGYLPGMSNTDFINLVYKNVLGRATGADATGLAYWNASLTSGQQSRGSLVNTILTSAHGFKGDPNYGYIASLLDNKLLVAKSFAISNGLSFNSPSDSIIKGIAIAAAVTPTDTLAALDLVNQLIIRSTVVKPYVATYGPAITVLNQPTTFTFNGTNLVNGMSISLDGCTGMTELAGGSSTTRYFSCTPTLSGTFSGQIKDQTNGLILAFFDVTVSPPKIPSVSSVTPISATAGRATTFSLNGTDLPSGMIFKLDNCSGLVENNSGTSTFRQFTCTPLVAGVANLSVTDKATGTVVFSYRISVQASTAGTPAPSTGSFYIDGEFNGWSGDTVVSLTNGQFWQQTDYQYSYSYGYLPTAIIFFQNGTYKMQVSGNLATVSVAQVAGIKAQISGFFNGWNGQTIVTLTNGQVWQQSDFITSISVAAMPSVTIVQSGGGYKMQVAGSSKLVSVIRLK